MALSQKVESSRAVIEPRAEGTPFLLDIAAKDRARSGIWSGACAQPQVSMVSKQQRALAPHRCEKIASSANLK
jgi:hypothetical protein